MSTIKSFTAAFCSLIVPFILITPLLARAADCSGSSCNGRDPRVAGCEADARDLTLTEGREYGPFWGRRQIRVVLKRSDSCNSNWTKADVPRGTVLFMRDINNQDYYPYTTNIDGWSFTDMIDGGTSNLKSCARIPDGTEYCTSPVP